MIDTVGNPAGGARVRIGTKEVIANSIGMFQIDQVAPGERLVQAEFFEPGMNFVAQNVVDVRPNELSRSVVLTMVPANIVATLQGSVRDSNGNLLRNARVFGNTTGFGSAFTLTDDSGNYRLEWLAPNQELFVQATGPGFVGDIRTVTLAPGETRTVDFTVTAADTGGLPAPTDFFSIAVTSPRTPRSQVPPAVLDKIIERLRPETAGMRGRTRDEGRSANSFVSVENFWQSVADPSLLGYGVYRGLANQSQMTALQFLNDPLAGFFADLDNSLQIGTSYRYHVTALSTSYPQGPNSESSPSNSAVVRPIGELRALDVTYNPLTFRWQPGSGGVGFFVFVYDRFPGPNASPIWVNDNPAIGTSLEYSGVPLFSGFRYFYIVVGGTATLDAITVSDVMEFFAP
ncbi:MAG: carboxypeptidase-like regulatory domain-containing protein [Fimbriimonadaceae bacterium]